jgi:hypothetical protein
MSDHQDEGVHVMTTDRSRAYARVTRTVADLGPTKLHDLEQRRIRNAADALIFAGTPDAEALAALDDIAQLVQALIRSGRWAQQGADRLARDIAACGPVWACVQGMSRAA